MSTGNGRHQAKDRAGYQEPRKFQEECKMKTLGSAAKINTWVSEHLGTKAPVKVLVGLAVGAMLITATAFIYQGVTLDKAGSLPSGSETAQTSQGPAYPASQDYEAEAILFDELRQSFIGVPAPASSETTQAFLDPAYWVQRYEAEEKVFEEMREGLVGKPVSGGQIKASLGLSPSAALPPEGADDD